MLNKKTILVVDDDEAINSLLTNSLSLKYQVDSLLCGMEAIAYCSKKMPDAILLDVNLGDIDGREVCTILKQEFGQDTPPLIFISGDETEQNVISCFDKGADDFIPKPFSPEQVLRKVEALLKYRAMINSLQVQSEELNELVCTTMSQASSYGTLLHMIKQLNHCDGEDEIAQSVFKYFSGQGLVGAIYFVNNHASQCFDQKSRICSPIVREVFELTHNKRRIYKLGNRMLASDQHCSLLIMNPPDENSEQYGVFIDIIAVLIDALEARYLGLLREQELSSLHDDLSALIVELHQSVEDVRSRKQKLIDDIVLRIGLSFHQLDLTESQEMYFNSMLEDTVMTHDDNNTIIMTLQQRLEHLVSEINELVKPAKPDFTDVGSDDVELF